MHLRPKHRFFRLNPRPAFIQRHTLPPRRVSDFQKFAFISLPSTTKRDFANSSSSIRSLIDPIQPYPKQLGRAVSPSTSSFLPSPNTMVRCPSACASSRWHCRVAVAVFSTFKVPTLEHESHSNDLDMADSSHGERPSLTIRLGLETHLPWTRDFLQLLEFFLIE